MRGRTGCDGWVSRWPDLSREPEAFLGFLFVLPSTDPQKGPTGTKEVS